MAMSIGIIHGDAFVACSPLGEFLDTVMRMVGQRRAKNEPLVNVIFVTHGSLNAPTHEGVKVVRYARKQNGIIVHVGLPKDAGDARHRLRGAVFEYLREAIEKAATKFQREDVDYDIERDLRALNRIERRLMTNVSNN